MDLNKDLRERLDIWFMLTRTQRRKLEGMGHCHQFMREIPLNDFGAVTKSKSLRKRFFRYKFSKGLRLVA